MVLIDSVSRYVDGVISKESVKDESFSEENLLEYPQYTRPEEFRGRKVPEVLLSRKSPKHRKMEKRKGYRNYKEKKTRYYEKIAIKN